MTSLWSHINNFHIMREDHHRLVSSSCQFCYDERWVRSGRHRPVGSGKHCGSLCHSADILPSSVSVSESRSQSLSLASARDISLSSDHFSPNFAEVTACFNSAAIQCDPVACSDPVLEKQLHCLNLTIAMHSPP